MIRLPECSHRPSPEAGLCLAAAALVLLPLDRVLNAYGVAHQVVMFSGEEENGRSWGILQPPIWFQIMWFCIPVVVVGVLILLGRVSRKDVGLTLGQPKVTLFWIALGAGIDAVARLAFFGAVILCARFTDWNVPEDWLQPFVPVASLFWPLILIDCVNAPLFEEFLNRGVAVPALERVGGWWFAILGSGVVWACVHMIVRGPETIPFYVIQGMFLSWVFLKSRSLLVPIVLHSLNNLHANLADWVLLNHPQFVRGVLDQS
jgi:membrane protease YdiL (CAAX protease family)